MWPIAILTGNVRQTLTELTLDEVWLHRGIVRGTGAGGPVCILPVDKPSLFKEETIEELFVHPSALHHPKLPEFEELVQRCIRN